MVEDRIYIEGTDALKPDAALVIFERLMGRPATAEERAEYEQDVAAEGDDDAK
jgi:hypothetical protein